MKIYKVIDTMTDEDTNNTYFDSIEKAENFLGKLAEEHIDRHDLNEGDYDLEDDIFYHEDFNFIREIDIFTVEVR